MGYWWVNHKQTFRHEVGGGYLWSPQRTKKGHRNPFWETMLDAVPGDGVVSYANGQIRHVGKVLRPAFNSRRPDEFGSTGEQWNKVGWRLPIQWIPLPAPFIPKAHLDQIRAELPEKYSPFNESTGGANQVYLAGISDKLFWLLLEIGGGVEAWSQIDKPTASGVAEEQATFDNSSTVSEEKKQVKVRVGQGIFRVRVRRLERACRLTRIENPRLLVASHIKPWRDCETSEERLDGANGLLLSPHVDRLFDRGLISFDDNGKVKQSPHLRDEDVKKLGLAGAMKKKSGSFSARQRRYLAYHREHVFQEE